MKIILFIITLFLFTNAGMVFRDSSAVIKRANRFEQIKGKTKSISQKINRGYIVNPFSDQAEVSYDHINLAPPEILFNNNRYREPRYQSYITKRDFNFVKDSIIWEFKKAFSIQENEIGHLLDLIEDLNSQSEMHSDRYSNLTGILTGATAFVTSLGALAGFFIRKKNGKKK